MKWPSVRMGTTFSRAIVWDFSIASSVLPELSKGNQTRPRELCLNYDADRCYGKEVCLRWSTPCLPTSPITISESLRNDGFAWASSDQLRGMLPAAALSDWETFAASWNDLGVDTYMADNGRYRRRRFSAFAVSAHGITRKPHQPHYQSRDYNLLNGGIERWFQPFLDSTADHAALHAILQMCFDDVPRPHAAGAAAGVVARRVSSVPHRGARRRARQAYARRAASGWCRLGAGDAHRAPEHRGRCHVHSRHRAPRCSASSRLPSRWSPPSSTTAACITASRP